MYPHPSQKSPSHLLPHFPQNVDSSRIVTTVSANEPMMIMMMMMMMMMMIYKYPTK
jgi:hypothetical protein